MKSKLSDKNSRQVTLMEMELFNRIAGEYAIKDLDKAQSIARKHRLEKTLESVFPDKTDVDILEIGCGAGFSANYLRGKYRTYHGIDFAEKLIQFAKEYNSSVEVKFEVMDVKNLPSSGKYDIIFMIGVLHHLDQVDSVMQDLKKNLNPGGWLVVNEPQRGNSLISFLRSIRKKIDSGYSENQKEYNAYELHKIFKDAGYQDISVKPQGFLSTPFAEVKIPGKKIAVFMAKVATTVDNWLDKYSKNWLFSLSWNAIAKGKVL